MDFHMCCKYKDLQKEEESGVGQKEMGILCLEADTDRGMGSASGPFNPSISI